MSIWVIYGLTFIFGLDLVRWVWCSISGGSYLGYTSHWKEWSPAPSVIRLSDDANSCFLFSPPESIGEVVAVATTLKSANVVSGVWIRLMSMAAGAGIGFWVSLWVVSWAGIAEMWSQVVVVVFTLAAAKIGWLSPARSATHWFVGREGCAVVRSTGREVDSEMIVEFRECEWMFIDDDDSITWMSSIEDDGISAMKSLDFESSEGKVTARITSAHDLEGQSTFRTAVSRQFSEFAFTRYLERLAVASLQAAASRNGWRDYETKPAIRIPLSNQCDPLQFLLIAPGMIDVFFRENDEWDCAAARRFLPSRIPPKRNGYMVDRGLAFDLENDCAVQLDGYELVIVPDVLLPGGINDILNMVVRHDWRVFGVQPPREVGINDMELWFDDGRVCLFRNSHIERFRLRVDLSQVANADAIVKLIQWLTRPIEYRLTVTSKDE